MRLQFCPTHSALKQGELPCAWPDCGNGSPDPQVEFLGISYKRESWKIDESTEFYFWHQSGTPYAYHLRGAAIHELRKKQGTHLPIIWHYTSIPAFKSIIETDELWLTDFEYLNDTTELVHGFSLISKSLRASELGITPPNADFDSKLKAMFKENLVTLEHLDSMPRISVVCFGMSSDGDDLTQWKGYGDGATGVAIGFNRDSPFFWHSPIATLGRVIYDDVWKASIANNLAKYIGFAASKDIAQEVTIVREPKNKLIYLYEMVLCDLLMEISVFLKDKAFSQENEVRFVYNRNIQNYDGPTHEGVAIYQSVESRFRLNKDVIVHYCGSKDIKSSISSTPQFSKLPIQKVILGPKASRDVLTKKAMKEFLNHNDYDGVDVMTSQIPFR